MRSRATSPQHKKIKLVKKGKTTRRLTPRFKTRVKRLTRSDGTQFSVTKSEKKFSRSIAIKRRHRERAMKEVLEKLKPDFKKQFLNQRKKGKFFIFRMSMNHNMKGKRIKQGYSTRRVLLRSEKEFEMMVDYFETRFLESMKKYLQRQDYHSITITGVDVEVINERKNKKRKRSKSRSLKRSKRKGRKKVSRL